MSLRRLAVVLFIPIPFLALAVVLGWGWRLGWWFALTGEERFLAQVKGLSDLAAAGLRPRLHLAPAVPAAHSGVNPFGVNGFLEQEPDLAVRERVVRMAAEAGFHWLRQEFPWEDIEIHGKGDFEDRRHEPARSAWEKYDHIVALAERYGMELIVRVSNPPAWTRAQGDAVGTFAPPDDYQDFADFVFTLVSRYRGRIRYYQLWNEPNIYPEWGHYAISPEEYTRLLCTAAQAARAADPEVVIINGALAATIVLDPAAPPPGNALNDFLFLQRMYDAGARDCFDIVAMQGYGLWSGPTDRRLNPRVINFARPLFIRDLMVANGDAHKAIWISEMNWNAVPDDVPDKRFGQVSVEQQARYLPLAYRRLQEEWPWLGVANTWYLKRPDTSWRDEGKPEYYFRLLEPDFTPLPVYESIKAYATAVSQAPVMYPGAHPAGHWAVRSADYRLVANAQATLGEMGVLADGGRLRLRFRGAALILHPPPAAPTARLAIALDGASAEIRRYEAGRPLRIAAAGPGPHEVVITATGEAWIDHWEVRANDRRRLFWPLLCGFSLLMLLYGMVVYRRLGPRFQSRRRP
jgi:hypothetical protein